MNCKECGQQVKDPKFKAGHFYKNPDGEIYLLAQSDYQEYLLIDLNYGNRWTESVADINKVIGSRSNDYFQEATLDEIIEYIKKCQTI